MKTDHKSRELHECDKCDNKIVLKWRLLKHKSNPDNKWLQKCHYFNNNVTCPFEEMGCMFAHEKSDMCKFDETCTKNLCSCRHTKSTEEETGDETSDDIDDSEENEAESCDFCGEVFGDIDDLIDTT